jgi:HrpA-like RNA helicase
VIDDTRFSNVIERGKNVLTRLHLGANEILQMAGRVHGRVAGGRVFILSDRDIQFSALRPTAPDFQLAGDSERVAMTCADLGVAADQLELAVPLDRVAYRKAVSLLERRGIIENGRLSRYGKAVEAMPVDRAWAELLVNADDELVPYLAVMSSIESLHRMTREDRDLSGVTEAITLPLITCMQKRLHIAVTSARSTDFLGIYSTRLSKVGPSDAECSSSR